MGDEIQNRKGSITRFIQFGQAYIILMNTSSPALLSEGCIRQLYTVNRSQVKQPVVQLIDFEESEANEKQITIRVSDGIHFVDCTLSGNYQITGPCISQTKNATTLINFKRFHIIKVADYFSKLDQTRICRLKIIIRRITDVAPAQDIIGNPQEIQQFMLRTQRQLNKPEIDMPLQNVQDYTIKKHQVRDQEIHSGKSQETCIKIENQEYVEYIQPSQNIANTNVQASTPSQTNANTIVKPKKEVSSQEGQSQGLGEPLTHQEILSGKEGFLIGRLVRFKTTRKDTKDGPMTVCYMGMLDKNDELIRIHLAGRLAMSNQKSLKKNKCYYIRGFDLVKIKNSGVQIRLKDKEYKILQIHNEDFIRQLKTEYFHWDHQNEIQNEYVDVIGIVEDVQNKTTYNSNNQIDNKSVIRVVVRNKFKSVRISFWTDQMKALQSFNIKKKEAIIFEDVRKKQSKYYDFGFQSSFIRLEDHPHLVQKYSEILPPVVEQSQPENIRELSKIYEQDPNNSKLRTITAYLTHCHENNMVYRLCDECKKKVERTASQCHECGSQNLVFKYNCRLQFSDHTGSIICILFDTVAHKLIGRTANEINTMSEGELQELFEPLFFRQYQITVEDRNQRLIMRSIDFLSQNEEAGITKDNVAKIKEVIYPSELWMLGLKM